VAHILSIELGEEMLWIYL